MSDFPRIFIGFDTNETVAAYTLAHTLQIHASSPISITFINRKSIPFFTRKRGELDSTDFSISRFLVPYLCGYEGYAIFMDSDMICLGDITEIWAHRNDNYAVRAVKHDEYLPKEEIKFLGNIQTAYNKKNWSSFMLFNNAKCTALDLYTVNTAHGLYLHRFEWLESEALIGNLPKSWNILIGVDEIPDFPKNLHYTSGLPCHPGYRQGQCADTWFEYLRDMLEAAEGDMSYLF